MEPIKVEIFCSPLAMVYNSNVPSPPWTASSSLNVGGSLWFLLSMMPPVFAAPPPVVVVRTGRTDVIVRCCLAVTISVAVIASTMLKKCSSSSFYSSSSISSNSTNSVVLPPPTAERSNTAPLHPDRLIECGESVYLTQKCAIHCELCGSFQGTQIILHLDAWILYHPSRW